MEGVEGDPDGQAQPQRLYGYAGQQAEICDNKVIVFEKQKQCQIEYHRGCDDGTGLSVVGAIFFHQHTMGIVDQNGQDHDQNIDRLSPAIKCQAEQQQHQIPQPQRRKAINEQTDGKIKEQKQDTAEYHAGLLSSCRQTNCRRVAPAAIQFCKEN